ncbi:DinB family protein [Nocardioides sp.]|uniref:DinB family protein n=1 Tax=Nocardioides sp. TaxID=35761 RepID=UPI003564A2FF
MTDDRISPPYAADEMTTLLGFLDWQRGTLRQKVRGLSREERDQRLAPSTMTLGGLVTHLAWVENWWFVEIFLGEKPAEPWASADWDSDEDWEWHLAAGLEADDLWELFDREVGRAREIVSASEGLDAVAAVAHRRTGEPISLRWIVVHMIEEYARHNGHADLIRESIDGAVGQ